MLLALLACHQLGNEEGFRCIVRLRLGCLGVVLVVLVAAFSPIAEAFRLAALGLVVD